METLLHTGAEHPDLLWIVVSAVIAFVFGTGIGAYLLKPRLRSETDPDTGTTER
ncbi:hypothetical protein ACFO5R_10365 [Halosolutus amylolyticus]|uniref:Uncharacterized protein n=1 Tax=Halosolutus amylolyticus TaxID=2932267 RepID=A0ABD5PPU3_9EURY|nr:hypothetical protein [Halosolutus amylolyticus]